MNNKTTATTLTVLDKGLSGLMPLLLMGIIQSNQLSPFYNLAITNFIAFITILTILVINGKPLFMGLHKDHIKDVILSSILAGVIFWMMNYWGQYHSTPQNYSIIRLLETPFTLFTMAFILKKEVFSIPIIIGMVCMLLSAVLLTLSNGFSNMNIGDMVIIAAFLVSPYFNYISKRAAHNTPILNILLVRFLIVSIIIGIIAYFTEPMISISTLNKGIWGFLLLNGIVNFGLAKIIFMNSLRATSVTETIVMSTLTPCFTFIFGHFFFNIIITPIHIISLIMSILGLSIIVYYQKYA